MNNSSTTINSPTVKPLRPNLILGICCLSLLVISMDVTIVNVGLPSIKKEFHASISGLQWIIDAYTMVVASLLIFAGSMADRFGRRRVFQIGMGLFTFGSILCSTAKGIDGLIAARIVQALGATMLNPVAMSIITNIFVEPKERARAIGVWSAIPGIWMALGPLVGGGLTQTVGWRWMFWINLPIGIAAMVLAGIFIRESKAAVPRKLDPVGQFLVITALASLIFAIIEGPHYGWQSWQILGAFGTALGSLAGFIFNESHRKEPLIDLRFFRSVPFSSATMIALLAFACFTAFLFLNAIYLQEARHLPAFITGVCTLPLAIAVMICAPISGRLVGTYGTKLPLMLAGFAAACSTLILSTMNEVTPMPVLLLAYGIFGCAFGLVNAPIGNTAISGMPKSQAGVAAAIASTSRQVGGSIGVALAGTMVGMHSQADFHFAQATHSVWLLCVLASLAIIFLGWLSNTSWALKTAENAAHLLDD